MFQFATRKIIELSTLNALHLLDNIQPGPRAMVRPPYVFINDFWVKVKYEGLFLRLQSGSDGNQFIGQEINILVLPLWL